MKVPIGIAAKTADDLVNIYRERNNQLEQLCRDMYYVIFDRTYDEVSTPEHNEFMQRMDALGLLEEE